MFKNPSFSGKGGGGWNSSGQCLEGAWPSHFSPTLCWLSCTETVSSSIEKLEIEFGIVWFLHLAYNYLICWWCWKLSLWLLSLNIFLLLLLLSRFSCVRLCATPEMAAHQAPPSLGFSRQEHWSGLPFPSPMHGSEKWKWSRSVVPTPSDPRDCGLPGFSVHGIFQARVLEWVAIAFSWVMSFLFYSEHWGLKMYNDMVGNFIHRGRRNTLGWWNFRVTPRKWLPFLSEQWPLT